jgi:uncharacterized protein YxjI
MYQYPLTFSFSALAITPNIQVKDASGRVLFSAVKKLLSSKEEIEISSGGKLLYKVISQESRITEIPSNWDVMTADGQNLGVVDDDFISALDNMKVTGNSVLDGMLQMQAHRSLKLRSAKMYWLKDGSGKQLGFITPDSGSLAIEQIPLYSIIKQLPFAYRLITPKYYVQFGDKTVMTLQKQRTFLVDTYTLNAAEKFSDSDEKLLVPAVVLAIVYERQQLKDLYT